MCATCSDSKTCTSCIDGYFLLNNSCIPCDPSCQTCFASGALSCLTCNNDLIFDHSLNLCNKNCSVGFYQDNCTDSLCCKEICGDGVNYTLPCDDGNLINDDGCSSICQIESGYFAIYNKTSGKYVYVMLPLFQATLELPRNSSQVHIVFSSALENTSITLFDSLNLSMSIKGWSSNLTFIDNQIIAVTLDYPSSFKSADFNVRFVDQSTFINENNQTLSTSELTITLPFHDQFTPDAQQIINTTSKALETMQTSLSITVNVFMIANFNMAHLNYILSLLQSLFYLSLIRINYPHNFATILQGGKMFAMSYLPNYFELYLTSDIKETNSIFKDKDISASFFISNGSRVTFFIIIFCLHMLLNVIAWITSISKLKIITSDTYSRHLDTVNGYIIVTLLWASYNMSYANWFMGISTVLTISLVLIKLNKTMKDLTRWDIQEETSLMVFDKYKRNFRAFGLLDIWIEILEGIILVPFEYYPILVIVSFVSISWISIILLIKYKPCKSNNLVVFNQIGLQTLQIICLIWASDDQYNFLNEDDRIMMGWIADAVAGALLISLLAFNLFKIYQKIKDFIIKKRSASSK